MSKELSEQMSYEARYLQYIEECFKRKNAIAQADKDYQIALFVGSATALEKKEELVRLKQLPKPTPPDKTL